MVPFVNQIKFVLRVSLFIYGESRSSSVKHSNNIASINKAVKIINGYLEAKYASTSAIFNDDVQCFPLLLFV